MRRFVLIVVLIWTLLALCNCGPSANISGSANTAEYQLHLDRLYDEQTEHFRKITYRFYDYSHEEHVALLQYFEKVRSEGWKLIGGTSSVFIFTKEDVPDVPDSNQ